MANLKRLTNRIKRKSKKLKKIRVGIKLHNILLIIIILKMYGIGV